MLMLKCRDARLLKSKTYTLIYLNKNYIFCLPRAQGAWLYSWFPWTPSAPTLHSVEALKGRYGYPACERRTPTLDESRAAFLHG